MTAKWREVKIRGGINSAGRCNLSWPSSFKGSDLFFFFLRRSVNGRFAERNCKVSIIFPFSIRCDHSKRTIRLFGNKALVLGRSSQQREMEAFLVKTFPLWRTGSTYSATRDEARVSVTALQKATHAENVRFGMWANRPEHLGSDQEEFWTRESRLRVPHSPTCGCRWGRLVCRWREEGHVKPEMSGCTSVDEALWSIKAGNELRKKKPQNHTSNGSSAVLSSNLTRVA